MVLAQRPVDAARWRPPGRCGGDLQNFKALETAEELWIQRSQTRRRHAIVAHAPDNIEGSGRSRNGRIGQVFGSINIGRQASVGRQKPSGI